MSITSRINEMSSHIEQAYDELQGLGADLTNVNKNIENISMVLDDIYDSLPSVSGEGTSLTLEDTRVGKIKSTLKGNTSQEGTPTPSSPIPINVVSGDNEINVVGKNLLNPNANIINVYFNSTTKQFQYNANNRSIVIPIKPNTTYTISRTEGYGNDFSIGTSVNYPTSGEYATNVSVKWSTSILTNTITSGANDKYLLFYFGYQTSESTSRGWLSKTQLEVGDQASTFEPYRGSTYNIDLPVENLFDDSTLNNKWVAQNGTITSATGANCIKYNCSANDTYTLSATFGTSNSSNIIVMAFYNSSDTLLNRYIATTNTSLTMTYTAPANTSYMYAGHYGVVSTTIQLEKGSKSNTYTPYGTTPIELCKIGNYQDYFYKDSGKWYLHKEIGKVVLNGGENWSYPSTNRFNVDGAVPNNNFDRTSSPTYYCDKYKGYNKTDNNGAFNTLVTNESYGFNFTNNSTNNTIRIKDTRYTSLDDFKTYLSNDNLGIYYALLTPTTTEITYQPLIDQLNLLEKAMSKDGQTNISQVNNDLPFIISASALKEWQESSSLNSTLSMVNPLSLGNTLNTQENNIQPTEVDNIEPLEEEENEES